MQNKATLIFSDLKTRKKTLTRIISNTNFWETNWSSVKKWKNRTLFCVRWYFENLIKWSFFFVLSSEPVSLVGVFTWCKVYYFFKFIRINPFANATQKLLCSYFSTVGERKLGLWSVGKMASFFLTSNDAVEVYILFDDFFFKNFSRLVFSVMNMFSFALQGFWVFCSDVPSTSNTFARRFWAFKNFQSKKLEVSGSYAKFWAILPQCS